MTSGALESSRGDEGDSIVTKGCFYPGEIKKKLSESPLPTHSFLEIISFPIFSGADGDNVDGRLFSAQGFI
ncbi:hypothetical protein RRG08_024290 [Elysia crispata]|uniref:Uncharacterized protein n=1 Tax=Elysia crispata TaxID=231223 RepID=A0AAE0ZKV8_9GAST|nr:hypothetical protein RRG08_024290 [Elysia crispata]